jgi:predicted dehydrogenase
VSAARGRERPSAGDHPLDIALVGYGYWGPNLARNLMAIPGCRLRLICDASAERLAAAAERHPGVPLATEWHELLREPAIGAVAVATPVSTHSALALEALRAGKHVFVEKPLAASASEARRLVEEAAARELVLMAGHVFVYAGAVRKLAEIVASERFGELCYYESTRVNSGTPGNDVNVLWDLAVHDLSILDHLVPGRARAVSATGASHLPSGLESAAYLTVFFDSRLIAHVNVNWLAPSKVRQTVVGGTGQTVVYDDLKPIEKLTVFDGGIGADAYAPGFPGRNGSAPWAPELDRTEALRAELTDFVDSIRTGRTPSADGAAGTRVVEMLEAASVSLRERGRPVELPVDG